MENQAANQLIVEWETLSNSGIIGRCSINKYVIVYEYVGTYPPGNLT